MFSWLKKLWIIPKLWKYASILIDVIDTDTNEIKVDYNSHDQIIFVKIPGVKAVTVREVQARTGINIRWLLNDGSVEGG